MNNFPQLKTQRLTLGKIAPRYIPEIVAYANNKNIADNVLNLPHPYTEKDAISWIHAEIQGFLKKEQYIFAIYLKDKFIGGVGLHLNKAHRRAELGYWIAEPYWGNGYAGEAVNKIIAFGFETLKLNKIFATHYTSNSASGRVLEKAGMKKEGESKQHYYKNGAFLDVNQYSLLKTDFYNEK